MCLATAQVSSHQNKIDYIRPGQSTLLHIATSIIFRDDSYLVLKAAGGAGLIRNSINHKETDCKLEET
jgi:hypothetical protein